MLWHVSPLHRISGSAWMIPTEIPQSDTKTTFWSTLAARRVATVLGKTRQPSVESQWGNYASSPPVTVLPIAPSNSGGEVSLRAPCGQRGSKRVGGTLCEAGTARTSTQTGALHAPPRPACSRSIAGVLWASWAMQSVPPSVQNRFVQTVLHHTFQQFLVIFTNRCASQLSPRHPPNVFDQPYGCYRPCIPAGRL